MSTVNERWLDYHGKDHDEPKAKTPPKSRPPMSRKPKVAKLPRELMPREFWVAIDAQTGVIDDWAENRADLEDFYADGDRYEKFVPFDPDAARVLKAAETAIGATRPPCEQCGTDATRCFSTEGDGDYWLCDSKDAEHGPEYYCGVLESRPYDAYDSAVERRQKRGAK